MKKLTQKLEKLNSKIDIIQADRSILTCRFSDQDDSVQSKIRVRANWSIHYNVDYIQYPGALKGADPQPWKKMDEIRAEIRNAAHITTDSDHLTQATPSRAKAALEARDRTIWEFKIQTAEKFLEAHKKATSKHTLDKIRASITALQAQQKALIPELRAANSARFAARKSEKQERAKRNALALQEGRFWDCDKETLKDYFQPPFGKNFISDVSEKWRAALVMECKSENYKNYYGEWRHKLVGTGRGYLCGIDDNGDEWGHIVTGMISPDDHGNLDLNWNVEHAMSILFRIDYNRIHACYRQGDLMFCPAAIPAETKLHDQPEPWEVRESHRIESDGLIRNGRFFKSAAEIKITHTSHQPVILPAGEYRLYTLDIPDAD